MAWLQSDLYYHRVTSSPKQQDCLANDGTVMNALVNRSTARQQTQEKCD